jgi:hypothetical protein
MHFQACKSRVHARTPTKTGVSMASTKATVSVDHVVMPFVVVGTAPTAGNFHDVMFTPKEKAAAPLCRVMSDVHGMTEEECGDCDTAAAFTLWAVKPPREVYDTDTGKKRPGLQIACNITTAIPEWSLDRDAPPQEREEVNRFILRTMVHERGHSLTGENAALAIKRVIDAMPDAVPAAQARAMNTGLWMLFRQFYIAAANDADAAYDAATNHGSVQGAEAVPHLGLGHTRPYDTDDGRPLPPRRASVSE